MKLIMENWRKFLKEAAADVSLDTKLKNAIVGTEDPDDNGIFGDEGGAVGIKGVEDKLKEKGIEILTKMEDLKPIKNKVIIKTIIVASITLFSKSLTCVMIFSDSS